MLLNDLRRRPRRRRWLSPSLVFREPAEAGRRRKRKTILTGDTDTSACTVPVPELSARERVSSKGKTLGSACVEEWRGKSGLSDTCSVRGGGGGSGGGGTILRGCRRSNRDASRDKLTRARVRGLTALELADSELGEGEQELLGFLVRDAERSECCQVGAHVRAAVADDDRVDGGRNLAFLQVSLLVGSARLVPDVRVASSLAQSHLPARVAQRYQQRHVPRVLLVNAFRQVVVLRAANLHQHNLDVAFLGQRGLRCALAPADEERQVNLVGEVAVAEGAGQHPVRDGLVLCAVGSEGNAGENSLN